jgi:hypothetical protein
MANYEEEEQFVMLHYGICSTVSFAPAVHEYRYQVRYAIYMYSFKVHFSALINVENS